MENPEKMKQARRNHYWRNREEMISKHNELVDSYGPGYRIYYSIKSRCENPNQPRYYWYGGKGIKCFITPEQINFIWHRDQASLLKRPSIDRIDSNDHYTFENCRFIELAENVRRAHKGKKHKKRVQIAQSVKMGNL